MAKEVTYRCNLCRSRDADPSKFIGVYFEHHTIRLQAAEQVESHLCNECVKNLKSAFGFQER